MSILDGIADAVSSAYDTVVDAATDGIQDLTRGIGVEDVLSGGLIPFAEATGLVDGAVFLGELASDIAEDSYAFFSDLEADQLRDGVVALWDSIAGTPGAIADFLDIVDLDGVLDGLEALGESIIAGPGFLFDVLVEDVGIERANLALNPSGLPAFVLDGLRERLS